MNVLEEQEQVSADTLLEELIAAPPCEVLQPSKGSLKAEVRKEWLDGKWVVVKDYSAYKHTWRAPVARFLMRREANMLQALRHWNHAPDFAGYQGRYAFQMEYVEGEPITKAYSHSGQLRMSQLLTVLDELHQQNITHNDVRGSNFLVDTHGNIVVIDFAGALRFPRIRCFHPLLQRLRKMEIAAALKFQRKMTGRPLTSIQQKLMRRPKWFKGLRMLWEGPLHSLMKH